MEDRAKELVIFGRSFQVVTKKSNKDDVRFTKNGILITTHKKSASSLMKEFLTDLLYSQLINIYDKLKRRGIEIFRDLDFEITGEIDGRKERVAKLKGNKILVKINAVALSKVVLEYIIAHEIAHILTKRHTCKFWKVVKLICPGYRRARELLERYAGLIT